MNKLHNAEVALELCRATLAQRGQKSASRALVGMEVVDTGSARLALDILRGTVVYGTIAGRAKAEAMRALEEAMKTPFYGDA